MVAKIKSGRSLIGALNYNENKVKNNQAQLIAASGYFKDLEDLNFYDKLLRLTDLVRRNERTKVNTVHISLNFAVTEQLEIFVLTQIIDDYMEQIGFAHQPYLAYKHTDAGHPHVHIVTTNIKATGERISLNLLGKTKSTEARKAIEIKYGLVKAGEKKDQRKQLESIKLTAVDYGKVETKRAITNVVNEVMMSYKFTSIHEFNAILNQYHISADRGSKDSRMYSKHGLVYWVLDDLGHKRSVPIRASSIYGKPTLKTLEDRFRLYEVLRKPLKEPLKKVLDSILGKWVSKAEFQKMLQESAIETIFRHNDEGRLYGVTFVDHQSRVVFNGSDLGKKYCASSLSQYFEASGKVRLEMNGKRNTHANDFEKNPGQIRHGHYSLNHHDFILDALFKEEQQDMTAIGRFGQKKRKKKRKGHSP